MITLALLATLFAYWKEKRKLKKQMQTKKRTP